MMVALTVTIRSSALAILAALSLAALDARSAVLQPGTAPPPSENAPTHELTPADANAWLDGFLPYVLAEADIAGAVVVVVKDGQVITQRGYGYSDIAARRPVDPATTLFRPGSISKLFTWTAVMQLVEKGKIDLDADVNQYLDFTIPPYGGKPVTMRNIMTHTPGFEPALKHLIIFEGPVPSLGQALKERLPTRVFTPGSTPAYSNYAVGVAGYVVERVSGIPFEDYIDRNVFAPIGMSQATFRQPLPAPLAPSMSKGYRVASADPEPFELVTLPPAGSSAVSGADMAKFMIAHLDEGAGLMQPATARLMHDPAYDAVPGIDRMALGFYEQRVNGLSAITHAGDAINFHSNLWLFPAEHVGLFISMNSEGTGRATHDIRLALFQQFGARYFPAAATTPLTELSTAKEHAKMLAGSYIASSGSFSNFLDAANFLGQVRVGLDSEGRPLVASFPNLAGAPRRWIEVAPFEWRDANGPQRLAAQMVDGRVVRWGIDDDSPINLFIEAPWYRDAAWLKPVWLAALAILALTALSWPVAAVARRRYGATNPLTGTDLKSYRLVRGFCWLTLAVWLGWTMVLVPRTIIMGNIDGILWMLEIVGALAGFGLLAVTAWNFERAWSHSRRRFSTLGAAAQAGAALALLWVMLAFHLISFGTKF